jgi:hypothetical protein
MDPAGIAAIAATLAGVVYPARTWRLLAQADHYGADVHTRALLARLPVEVYANLEAVMSALRQLHPAGPATSPLAAPS